MSEEPKVISLRSRQAYTPPAPEPIAEDDGIDHQAIEVLEMMLADFKRGEVRGLVAATWDNEAKFFRRAVLVPVGEDAPEFSHRLLGACAVLEEACKETVLYLNEYAGIEEVLEEDGA